MSSILNEGEDDTGGGGRTMNYLTGGFDDEQRRVRRVSLKQLLFKVVNLLTFHNVITNTVYIVLLLGEFVQFLGFLFYKLALASNSMSAFADTPTSLVNTTAQPTPPGVPTTQTTTVTGTTLQLAYVSYFNMKQLLMQIRTSATDPSSGATTSYVIAGLALFIIAFNFMLVAFLCRYARDGYDALFASPFTKMMLKACGVVQVVFLKVLFLPLLMILVSIVICTTDPTLANTNTANPTG